MKRSLIGLTLFLLTMKAQAMMPVIDAAAIAQLANQLEQMKAQYDLLNETYQNATQQLETSKSQLDGINRLKDFNSGNYGYGGLSNGLDELKNWQSSADNWDDALKNISGGNQERYAQLVKAYDEAHPALNETALHKGASPERISQYQQHRAVNKAASVQTTYAFNEINQHLKSIHTLSTNIEKAPNTKSAVDLNSRLIAEVAYIQVLNLKLQTLISQQLVQNSSNELADDGEMIRFNTLPDE